MIKNAPFKKVMIKKKKGTNKNMNITVMNEKFNNYY